MYFFDPSVSIGQAVNNSRKAKTLSQQEATKSKRLSKTSSNQECSTETSSRYFMFCYKFLTCLGPFRSPQSVHNQRYRALSPSLRVLTPFDSEEQQKRTERDKEWTRRIQNKPMVCFQKSLFFFQLTQEILL